MRKKGCLQSGRLSERAASKLALNVLGMSTLRLIAKSLHRVGFAETHRDVRDREKFSVASMGRRKCALWTSGTGARSTCGLTDLRVGPVGGGGAIMEIPYLALTEDFSEVRDI